MKKPGRSDVWQNYLVYRPALATKISALTKAHDSQPSNNELITNLAYATAIARIIYCRVAEPSPSSGDINKQAIYWKK